jgi:hypothetical protein
MLSTETLFQQLATGLGLAPGSRDSFFGAYRGYPVVLSLLLPQAEHANHCVFLAQIRHILDGPAELAAPDHRAPQLSSLLNSGRAQLEIASNIAWLSVRNGRELLRQGLALVLLEEAVNLVFAAGGNPHEGECHTCLEVYDGPVYFGEKSSRVARICPECLDPQLLAVEAVRAGTPSADRAMMLATVPATILGGAVWSLSWIGYELVLRAILGARRGIHIPKLLIIVIVLGVTLASGAACAHPLRVKNRSASMARTLSILCSIGAIILGEMVFAAWVLYDAGGELPDRWQACYAYWASADLLRVLMRVCSAAGMLGFAAMVARPRLPDLTL